MGSMFDVKKLADFAQAEIEKFSLEHSNETFYAFAIDESRLCFNSVGHFEKALKELALQSPRYYDSPEKISTLRNDPDGWAYHGFACFRALNRGFQTPFDEALFQEHNQLEDKDKENSDYSSAMNEVLKILMERNVFQNIQRTKDFKIRNCGLGSKTFAYR
ncbi:DUF4303 domain-containing protein [Leptospira kmetyi]|uniref:DUF4303 domain-containing protein n=2 Tax=Leptospira kmetyi TaxID=408139 RepID=A0ABX4NE77_9LEPT|nr:DUF4303 domain-containing protein [Leptospira kmetyi]PJZ43418.1 DUF4303 domain-containing protein [Leptospira kmetyi]TGL67986.1 DUF4303 domain-containing protein [Leptospira kmetyi]